MAKSKSSKAGKDERGCILIEEQINRLGILLEQIEGTVDLLDSDCDFASDAGAMTALAVIKERCSESGRILNGNYGKMPASALRLRQRNLEHHAAMLAKLERRSAPKA